MTKNAHPLVEALRDIESVEIPISRNHNIYLSVEDVRLLMTGINCDILPDSSYYLSLKDGVLNLYRESNGETIHVYHMLVDTDTQFVNNFQKLVEKIIEAGTDLPEWAMEAAGTESDGYIGIDFGYTESAVIPPSLFNL